MAAWSRTKKMPQLDTVLKNLDKKPRKKKQSALELFDTVKAINAAFGGE